MQDAGPFDNSDPKWLILCLFLFKLYSHLQVIRHGYIYRLTSIHQNCCNRFSTKITVKKANSIFVGLY